MELTTFTLLGGNMANDSLSTTPFSHNDVLVLARLFEVSFDYYRHHTSPNVSDFIGELRTLAGLGLTASLVDGGGLYPYQIHFDQFIRSNKGDFRGDPGTSALWGQLMAGMLTLGLDSFRRLGYPGYYADFIETIEKMLKNIRIDLAGKSEEAQRIFNLLPCKPRRRLY
jgi:hypothetical protein